MKKLLLLILLLSVSLPVYAGEAEMLSQQYNRIFAEFLRHKLVKIPRDSNVEVFLKDGTKVVGVFEAYISYDDSVFIQPSNKHGLFSDVAYSVNDLQDIQVIFKEPI